MCSLARVDSRRSLAVSTGGSLAEGARIGAQRSIRASYAHLETVLLGQNDDEAETTVCCHLSRTEGRRARARGLGPSSVQIGTHPDGREPHPSADARLPARLELWR
jgi:hypothetical protein